MRTQRPASAILAGLLLAFLAFPIVVIIAASFTPTGDLRFPPQGFSLRWYARFFADPSWLNALGISAALAAAGACIGTAIAFSAAFVTSRWRFPLLHLYEVLLISPLIVPHAALALVAFGLASYVGLRGTFLGLLLAHVLLILPFAYRPIITSMRAFDYSMEEAAMSLGARPAQVVRRITLPLLRPALVSALLFSFIISFDEVTVSLFLIGPEITTLPLQIFGEIQDRSSPVVAAISTLLIGVTCIGVLLLERLVGLQLFVDTEGASGGWPQRHPEPRSSG
jgi:putative spermidine/putrescine transport system permease protein